MKILKIKYYKRPTLQRGSASCNVDGFTIEQLENAKRLIELGISAKRDKKLEKENERS